MILSLFNVIFFFIAFAAADGSAKKGLIHVDLTDKDVVPLSEMPRVAGLDEREGGFIGDLIIGQRRADETVFRRTVQVSNPTKQVYSTAISLNVNNGIIHHLSVFNERGSYGVVCDEPYTLGKSRSSFNVRVPPNTESSLSLIVAAH
ncbi:uncharacterized protein LOC117178748 [Belonocnema kinseyi]|uniref:uncharacterized protein LOC117178748 n=1 Tax=Belonocnema kinseyi TaxID=2817044 RepID=UPI00143CFD7D|nr:uncharacterized protein LOC117178748 [Belonocnema kinseyi]